MGKKTLLTILDGWGIGQVPEVDAIHRARTPFFDHLIENYPNATLITHGEEVGLPQGQMGNSEVGHLNIGAGRIVYQELARINKAISDGSFSRMPAIVDLIQYAKSNRVPIHIMGLVSDGGVHSHIEHLKALCTILDEKDLERVYVHAFMDGRDTDPKSGIKHLQDLQDHIEPLSARIASIVGRYFAMDRDLRWERIQKAYDLLVKGDGRRFEEADTALSTQYEEGITDEFIQPCLLDCNGLIKPDHAVLFFNFRTDRPRQLVRALSQQDFPSLGMAKLPLYFVTMVNYDTDFENIHIIYDKSFLKETLGEVIAGEGLTQVRIAETEKYPHVTFFFNGGREEAYENEDRILIPSPKVATYDLAPEMSAIEVTDAICERMERQPPNFICLNFANADMVGHTGIFAAAVKACETVDSCLERVVNTALEQDYQVIIIADHGNSDIMVNGDGSPHTAHTTNPVPIIYVSNDLVTDHIRNGKLADIAPTLLQLMQIDPPGQMTGKSLLT